MRALLLLAALLALPGCRFERRPELSAEGARPNADVTLGATSASSPLEDSVRAVVAAFGEALEVGDVARVALLTVPTAMLVDQEEAVRWTRDDPTTPLPRALSPGGDALTWDLEASHFVALGASSLLVNEYTATAEAGVPWKAVETFLLVRTEDGWRLRHLHRSRGPAGGEPLR